MKTLSKKFWLVALYLSKFGETLPGKKTTPPKELNTYKWKDAYKVFYKRFNDGKTIKTFENSLKNCRDTYDGHIDNSSRKGWRDLNRNPIKLPTIAKSVLNKYSSTRREEIWKEIYSMISNTEKTKLDKKEMSNDLFSKKSLKNPSWRREELILALDLYFNLDYGQMHGTNPKIIELSKSLRELNLIKEIPDKAKFRSVSSVALKLANFKKFDQNFTGKGMGAGAKHDKEIWNEFHKHINTLKKEADLIRQLYLKPNSIKILTESESKVNYKSEFIFQIHKIREMDPLAIKLKKKEVLFHSKSLKCEVCGFDSVLFYGELGNDLMEIHYNKELKSEPELEIVGFYDFIIVCSNCHKALDKNYGLIEATDLKKIIKKK
ncbi:MAG TPA: hypothetical protein PKA90_12610 [Ignavibacteria bacterium]|nr:hypothetical protein [Ignavibacteria bacterium]HMR41261.1 hypothetical protein [Ignavibacteria bacterium]